ncbi:hypothetical protein LXL04_026166 [Taraxacum kok-saghyz]
MDATMFSDFPAIPISDLGLVYFQIYVNSFTNGYQNFCLAELVCVLAVCGRDPGSNPPKSLRFFIIHLNQSIWKVRNGVIFENLKVEIDREFRKVIELSFLWLNSRFSKFNREFRSWTQCPKTSLKGNFNLKIFYLIDVCTNCYDFWAYSRDLEEEFQSY